ncbi:hypothetical protein 4 [Wuhan spider virus 9]|uniref:hypothetical protein 4 n=1 Tax=Wuhan spider virus 9 TaxID=1923758 RepID=UPI00090CB368|nr:hypothetical protein 4 [Wuhan spider virus 9]APG76380.1 hypothetical protein 4 [Wuhan spider virus 9]
MHAIVVTDHIWTNYGRYAATAQSFINQQRALYDPNDRAWHIAPQHQPLAIVAHDWQWDATYRCYISNLDYSWAVDYTHKISPQFWFSVHMPKGIAMPVVGAVGSDWDVIQHWIHGVPVITHIEDQVSRGAKIGGVEYNYTDLSINLQLTIPKHSQNFRINLPLITLYPDTPYIITVAATFYMFTLERAKKEQPGFYNLAEVWFYQEGGAPDEPSR